MNIVYVFVADVFCVSFRGLTPESRLWCKQRCPCETMATTLRRYDGARNQVNSTNTDNVRKTKPGIMPVK